MVDIILTHHLHAFPNNTLLILFQKKYLETRRSPQSNFARQGLCPDLGSRTVPNPTCSPPRKAHSSRPRSPASCWAADPRNGERGKTSVARPARPVAMGLSSARAACRSQRPRCQWEWPTLGGLNHAVADCFTLRFRCSAKACSELSCPLAGKVLRSTCGKCLRAKECDKRSSHNAATTDRSRHHLAPKRRSIGASFVPPE